MRGERSAARICRSSTGTTVSSGGGRRRNEPRRSSSSASSGASEGSARPHRGNTGAHLERRSGARGELARGGNSAVRDEDRSREARLRPGRQQAHLGGAQALERRQLADDALERADAVAQAARVLVAKALGEVAQAGAQARERAPGREPAELVLGRPVERARRTLGAPPAADRAERARLRGDDEPPAARPQVEGMPAPLSAGVRRRAQLPDQAELLERGLHLGAEHGPLDAVDGGQRRLDRRPLPLRAEVRAQPRAQVARPPDVERLAPCAAEDVDAGARGRAEDQRALVVDATAPRRGEVDEVGDRARAALLREADERDEDLGRRLRVRESAMARAHRRAEEVRERREPDASDAPGEQPPGEADRVHDGRRQPSAGDELDLTVEERQVEAGVVRDQDGAVAGEGEEAADRGRRARRSAEVAIVDPGQPGDHRRERDAGIDERLERPRGQERLDADGADLADPGPGRPQARRLEVDDHEAGRLERQPLPGRRRRARRSPRARRAAHHPRRRPRAGPGRAPPGRARARRASGPPPRREPAPSAPRPARRAGRPRRTPAAPVRAYTNICSSIEAARATKRGPPVRPPSKALAGETLSGGAPP